MENPVDSSCGTMSVSDCLDNCAVELGCTAVNWQRTGGSIGNCLRKANIELEHCDRNTPYDLWLAKDKS